MNHLGSPMIETTRLLMKPANIGDAASCVENWAADEKVYSFISQTPRNFSQMQTFLASVVSAYQDASVYYWLIQQKCSGKIIGEIFVDDFSEKNQWCELNYKIGTAFSGQRFATEAVKAIIDFLTCRVGFHRIQAKCLTENLASEQVMKHAGMQREGVWTDWYFDGHSFKNIVQYSFIRPNMDESE